MRPMGIDVYRLWGAEGARDMHDRMAKAGFVRPKRLPGIFRWGTLTGLLIVAVAVAICLASAVTLAEGDYSTEYWISSTAKAYGLSEYDVRALLDQGMAKADVAAYLEAQYPHEPFELDTQDIVDLAADLGADPLEVVRAYGVACKYSVGVQAVMLLRDGGEVSWEEVEAKVQKFYEMRKEALEGTKLGKVSKQDRFATAAQEVYGLSPEHIRALYRRGFSDNQILALLFAAASQSSHVPGAAFAAPIDAADFGRASAELDSPDVTAALVDQAKRELDAIYSDLRLEGPWEKRVFPGKLKAPSASAGASRSLSQEPAVAPPVGYYDPLGSWNGADGRSQQGTAGPRAAQRAVEAEAQEAQADSGTPPSIIDPGCVYNSGRVSPFRDYFEGFSESVDPNSGCLIVRQRDFTLPGRGGLDFTLERVYISQSANMYVPRVQVIQSAWCTAGSYAYSYTEEIQGSGYVESRYYELVFSYSGGRLSSTGTIYGSITGTCYVSRVWDSGYLQEFSETVNTSGYRTPDPSDVYYETEMRGFTSPNTYLDGRYRLGVGWSLNLPSLESIDSQLFLHMGDGTVYKVDWSNPRSHLKDYPLEDMVLLQDSGTYSNGQESSKYILKYKDGRSVYFSQGGRLLGIKDRYGNEIRFRYQYSSSQYGPITQITDSVGRIITFDYSNPAQVRVTVEGRTWTYNLSSAGADGR